MRGLLIVTGCLLLVSCASERVVLLPSPDGQPSAVIVNPGPNEQRLDQPYAASVRRLGSHSVYRETAAEVQERFGPALAAQPARPRSFIVYFEEGKDVLTSESVAAFAQVKADILKRGAAEVTVIGHTDRVGSLASNDELSRQRAAMVRDALVAAGLDPKLIEIAGRGEREPLVPTADEVAEPKNRRVEISVR